MERVIYCPPVKSSGDVYHIAGLFIARKALCLDIPEVVFFHDTEDTRKHAKRSTDFLSALGFRKYRTIELVKGCTRARYRDKSSRLKLEEIGLIGINQKA
eukprot:CAMPEP_0184023144 /NCGR_PEP_ID=MMETSP0954-20121128/11139_1 /TAXON_ID=627963 /ORGANISM="Aplanochytrium sp, Strain PBS07" /LENGTH=99 /DNA_ID=CAMNT_0026305879 /DNA_START=247 /DNA_END=543 /DNA_ORIENTATION=-